MKSYSTVAAIAVFLFLIATNFYYHSKYNEQRALTAAQSLTIAGLNMYVKQTERNYIVAVSAGQDKNNALLDSKKRIEELEAAIQSDSCASISVPIDASCRLYDRANSFYKPAAATE